MALTAAPLFGGDGHTDILHPGGSTTVTLDVPGMTYVLVNSPTMTDSSAHAFEIAANSVTLDLNGNRVTGTGTGTADGVRSTSGSGTRVVNGRFDAFDDCINLDNTSVVENVTASNCDYGITLESGTVREVQTLGNDEAGIAVEDGTIEDCYSDGDEIAIEAESAKVRGCVVVGAESRGIVLGTGQVLDSQILSVESAGGIGIVIGEEARRGGEPTGRGLVSRCLVRNVGEAGRGGGGAGAGIRVVNGTVENSVVMNTHGISIAADVARDNQVGLPVDGAENVGIAARSGGLVAGNTILGTASAGAGIFVSDESDLRIEDNQISGLTSGAGIMLEDGSQRVVIAGNTVIGNFHGIEILDGSTDNVVIRNVSLASLDPGPTFDADYEIQTGNDVAPITTAAGMTHPQGNVR